MRVGIVSDTHGFVDPRVLEAIAGCEVVVHGGDVGSAEVLRALRGVSPQVIAARTSPREAGWAPRRAAIGSGPGGYNPSA